MVEVIGAARKREDERRTIRLRDGHGAVWSEAIADLVPAESRDAVRGKDRRDSRLRAVHSVLVVGVSPDHHRPPARRLPPLGIAVFRGQHELEVEIHRAELGR